MGQVEARISALLGRHWRLWVLLFWAVTSALMIFNRWKGIGWFALPDTDDNMRIMQVRAWLAGQDWYDLRQHRLDPPLGASIHWSRLVDLPIAAILVLLKPLLGGAMAEKVAVSVAPLLPMLVAMGAIAALMRRLLSPNAFMLGLVLLVCAHSTRLMWTPLRIDHHGWQLALLSLVMLSFAVKRAARGGALLGIASALSLAIGLEMLIYLALAGALTVGWWIHDERQRPRILAYGAALAGGTALGYLVFASRDNGAPLCDALTPVWLSAMVTAGAVAVLLTLLPLRSPLARLGAAALGGALLAAGFAYSWPHCLGRLEAVSPELNQLWLSKVREAKPLWRGDLTIVATTAGLPVVGLVGYGVMLWRLRADRDAAIIWAALAILCATAFALLSWQVRAGPAAQLLGVPGAAALGWLLLPRLLESRLMLVRVAGPVLTFLVISGLGGQYVAQQIQSWGPSLASSLTAHGFDGAKFPKWMKKGSKRSGALKKVDLANRRCPTLPALHPVALQPKGLVLTFVDLGPRLITVTHHDAIAGPYHRNGTAILDVSKTFRGTEENARQMVKRRLVDYVLICPGMSESTVYVAEAPKGFYARIAGGHVPDWLAPVTLPANSPYRMWRVVTD